MAFDLATFLGQNVGAAFGQIAEGVGSIIAKFKADPTKVLEMQAELQKLQLQAEQAAMQAEVALSQAQTKVNEIEAASGHPFTSNWRPWIGWVCGSGFAYVVVLQPFLTWASAWISTGHPGPAPTLNTDVLMTVLLGMLGLGGLRSFDKLKGTARP